MSNKNSLLLLVGSLILLVACTKQLNQTPTNAITSEKAYSSLAGYKSVLAKVYGSFALPGNNGVNQSDLAGIDPGQGDFLRLYWNAQELSTDEAACVWNDPGIPDFHNLSWTSGNTLLTALYNRILFHITICNEFIRESTDEKLAARGITGADAEEVKRYRAEARYLRAFQYWVAMDLFGNPPFVTENDPIGKYLPRQITSSELFAFIETELLAIEEEIAPAKQNEYGRSDQGAVWALLARMYLNAETYLGAGNGKYTEAISYAGKVIQAGYSLKSSYRELFLGDNDEDNDEAIFSIVYDGTNTQNNGGTTFLVNASINVAMNPSSFGVPGSDGWGGNRSTKNLPLLFGDYSGAADKRAMFMGNKIEIENPAEFTDGLAVAKYRNITREGDIVFVDGGAFVSIDFPLFRLGEVYLTYAEAVLRGGQGGTMEQALNYVNMVRDRAFQNTGNRISSITLKDILDERGRELYWEAVRRTDLIRYKLFTGNEYLWPWKGGVRDGRGAEAFRVLFPLPATDLTANPNLQQNQGY